MDRVRMHTLLRADGEVERLEREGRAAIQLAEKVQKLSIGRDGANIVIKLPGVLGLSPKFLPATSRALGRYDAHRWA